MGTNPGLGKEKIVACIVTDPAKIPGAIAVRYLCRKAAREKEKKT